MKKFKQILFLITLVYNYSLTYAQCNDGEIEIEITVHTDDYGSEGYWEIVPIGNPCGTETIAFGGNMTVGCDGGGAQNSPSGGYGDNLEITEGPWCLNTDQEYVLYYRDDFGDAGFGFDVKANGYQIENFETTSGAEFSFSFTVNEPPALDLGMYNLSSPYLYDNAGSKAISGILFNYGTENITSFDLNYQINEGDIVSSNIDGLNISNFEAYSFNHPTLWEALEGIYTLNVWTSNVNGAEDLNPTNDVIIKTVEIGQGIPNIIDLYLSSSPQITEIGNNSDQLDKPTDLDFHPLLSKKELWVINKRSENEGGSTVIYNNAGESTQSDELKVDGNAWHFMSLPTGIAFSKNGNFANSTGVLDANHDGGEPFTGPALWSGDLAIYAQPSGGNGSHLDMLHASPYCQGIASEKDNVFWVFDGYSNDIVRYDFVDDHGPGNSFHGDAIIHRYNDFSVAKDPNDKVVSHLVVSDQWVYVVDYGNKKVFRIELNTGDLGETPTFGPFEEVVEYKYVNNYNWEDVVTTDLIEPAGIDIIEDRMIVSDYATSEVIIYDISSMPATELGRIHTGAQGIMGVKIGPEGNIWYVDYDGNTVNKIDRNTLTINEKILDDLFMVYPNPSTDHLNIRIDHSLLEKDNSIRVFNSNGQQIFQKLLKERNSIINIQQWSNGIYKLEINSNQQTIIKKITVLH